MTKRTITILWLIGLGVMIAGGLVTIFSSLALAFHIGALSSPQPSITYVPDGPFWTLVSCIILGSIALLGSLVIQIAAWVGAVINANRLVDKTWYNVLLWCGLAAIVLNAFGGLGILIGWVLMLVYVVGGPDSMAVTPTRLRATPPEPKTLAPTG